MIYASQDIPGNDLRCEWGRRRNLRRSRRRRWWLRPGRRIIQDKKMDKLFQNFTRVHKTKTKQPQASTVPLCRVQCAQKILFGMGCFGTVAPEFLRCAKKKIDDTDKTKQNQSRPDLFHDYSLKTTKIHHQTIDIDLSYTKMYSPHTTPTPA